MARTRRDFFRASCAVALGTAGARTTDQSAATNPRRLKMALVNLKSHYTASGA